MKIFKILAEEFKMGSKKELGPTTPSSSETSEPSTPKSRFKAPFEKPFIKPENWGKFDIKILNRESMKLDASGFYKGKEEILKNEQGDPFRIEDLSQHLCTTGMPGCAKTTAIAHQFLREILRSTHIPDGPEREKKKPGICLIEGKGDFAIKLWKLALQYGRSDDVRYFGPAHDTQIDPFGDPTMSPSDKAAFLISLLHAISGGKNESDPFWVQSAEGLANNIMLVWHYSKKWSLDLEPMCFTLLSNLVQDLGAPLNKDLVDGWRKKNGEAESMFEAAAKELRSSTRQVSETIEMLNSMSKFYEDEAGLYLGESPERKSSKRAMEGWGKVEFECQNIKMIVNHPPMSLDEESPDMPNLGLRDHLNLMREHLEGFLFQNPDFSLGKATKSIAFSINTVNYIAKDLLLAFENEKESWKTSKAIYPEGYKEKLLEAETSIRDQFIQWGKDTDRINDAIRFWVNVSQSRVTEEFGSMRTVIDKFTQRFGQEKETLAPLERNEVTKVLTYFKETHFNVVKDKTQGSVASTLMQLTEKFSTAPFNRMFAPGGTFDFKDIFNKGLLFCVDMPFAYFQTQSDMVAMVLKMLFFKAGLSREFMQGMDKERHCPYFSDEFQEVMTNGKYSGEQNYFNRSRGFRSGCLIFFQNISQLYDRFKEDHTNSLLGLISTQIVMRNVEQKTKQYGSELSGTRYQAHSQRSSGAIMGGDSSANNEFSFTKEKWLDPEDFENMAKGDSLTLLPERFGKKNKQRLAFVQEFLPDPDPENKYPMPNIHRRPSISDSNADFWTKVVPTLN